MIDSKFGMLVNDVWDSFESIVIISYTYIVPFTEPKVALQIRVTIIPDWE